MREVTVKNDGKIKRLLKDNEKSVIDYVMTNAEYLISNKWMIIDKTKEYESYTLKQQNQDHNLILLRIDFYI